MAENESFFRKVVRFVANPATDWSELNSRPDESRELELEKTELKAMIERKRRNDFVRKREFDMLRRIRREGLTPEQAAQLDGASRMDDSEARLPSEPAARPDATVKAKIDEIEQQMVGDAYASTRRATLTPAPTGPASLPAGAQASVPPTEHLPMLRDVVAEPATVPPRLDLLPEGPATRDPASMLAPSSAPSPMQVSLSLPPLSTLPGSFTPLTPPERSGPRSGLGGLSGSAPLDFPEVELVPRELASPPPSPMHQLGDGLTVEVSEVVHDAELDEPVIAFANADFQQCEDALHRITSVGGARSQHPETWLVLFDLYRATGQHQRFEALALDYAQQFGLSAPQWYSLPKLVADAAAEESQLVIGGTRLSANHEVGWVCPEQLDLEAVARLRSQTLQMPLPWVFDWSRLNSIEAEAAMQLSTLLRLWSSQAIEMRWVAGDRLFQVLQEAAPTGVRDADPAFWLTRLDALRLANRADQFDEAAIDYCVTYEVSPPSWEPARCKVLVSSSSHNTRAPSMSMVSTSFMESRLSDEPDGSEVAHVELSGQLLGDISSTLEKLQTGLGNAPVVNVSCARLIRVDFIAAGDLLNWVLARRAEGRTVLLSDTHRLLALFFGAMGINEHAKVQVRKV